MFVRLPIACALLIRRTLVNMVSNNYMCLNHFEYIMEIYTHLHAFVCACAYMQCNTLRHSLFCHSLLFSSPFMLSSSVLFFFLISNLFLSPNKLFEDRDLFHGKSIFFTVERMCMDDGDGGGNRSF